MSTTRRALTAAALVAAGAAVLPSAAPAAMRDVRVAFTNDTDRRVELQFAQPNKQWRDLRGVDAGETAELTRERTRLTLWVQDCGVLTIDNPLVGRPDGYLWRNPGGRDEATFSEDDTQTLAVNGVRFSVHRSDDSDDFKEFEVTLESCDYDAPAKRPREAPPLPK